MGTSRPQDDFLKECMSDIEKPIPLDTFNVVWCRLCGRRECVRAGLNSSVFDVRTRNWRDNLFLKVPRAEDNDPRYSNIRAKKFLPLAPSSEVWTNAVAVVSPDPDPQPPDPAGPGLPDPPEEESPDTDPNPEPEPEPNPEPNPADGSGHQAPIPQAMVAAVNTPFQQGSMIGGREALRPAPVPAPVPSLEEAKTLGSDSTYTFDDD